MFNIYAIYNTFVLYVNLHNMKYILKYIKLNTKNKHNIKIF
jgi:hypothetical protein